MESMVDPSILLQEADMASLIQDWVGAIILTIVIAFALPIIFVITLRYTEKYDRESWRDLISSFIWGATVSVVAVILIRGWFMVEFRTTFPLYYQYLAAIVITPVAAELIKAMGLFFNRDAITESEDGLIHGGTIGLGYSATENLLYGIFLFTTYGFKFFVVTMAVRSFSVVLINCVTTAIVCYGISRFTARTHTQRTWYMFPLFYLAAVAISGTFNFLAITGERLFGTATVFSYGISLVFAIVLALIMAGFIYVKIYRLDRLDAKPREQLAPGQGAPPPGGYPPPRRQPQRDQYRPPAGPGRGVRIGNVPHQQQRPPPRQQRPPPRQQQRPPPRQQRPPPRQQQRPPPRQQPPRRGGPVLGPQGPPRPLGPHNKSRGRSSPKPPANSKSQPTRPSRSRTPPAKPKTPPKKASKAKFELEEEDDFEFKPRKSPSKRSSKKASMDWEKEEDFEFKPRSKSRGAKKKSTSMDWEDDEYEDWG